MQLPRIPPRRFSFYLRLYLFLPNNYNVGEVLFFVEQNDPNRDLPGNNYDFFPYFPPPGKIPICYMSAFPKKYDISQCLLPICEIRDPPYLTCHFKCDYPAPPLRFPFSVGLYLFLPNNCAGGEVLFSDRARYRAIVGNNYGFPHISSLKNSPRGLNLRIWGKCDFRQAIFPAIFPSKTGDQLYLTGSFKCDYSPFPLSILRFWRGAFISNK